MAYLGHIKGPHPDHPLAGGPKVTFRSKPEQEPKGKPAPPKAKGSESKG